MPNRIPKRPRASNGKGPASGSSAVGLSKPPRPRLEQPKGLYKLLVESVRDYAIFALDPTGHIITWNIGAQRLKGYRADEIIGKHFSIFYPPEDQQARKPDKELAVAVAEGRVEDEGWRVRKDGSRFWANVVITALRNPSGKLVGFAKVTRDLTERRAAEERSIEDARRIAEAEASNRTKSTFLASMSHELRTPLNAIGGYADLLLFGVAGDLISEQRDYLDRLRRSQQHLLAIINDLLNFSRIEAGRITYDMQRMSLGKAIRAVLPMVEQQASQRDLELRIDETPDYEATADPSKVVQILLNLLSNAIKFTEPAGSISIQQFARDDHVGIRVSDTGIGIPEDKLESIFEPFVQVGRTLTTPHEGTGLGLAISRDLARAMNGDIAVRSTLEKGSVFELVLRRGELATATDEGQRQGLVNRDQTGADTRAGSTQTPTEMPG
jgi:PAS domain S-box-containing protein